MVSAAIRSFPLDFKGGPCRHALGPFQFGRARIFHDRRWRCLDFFHGLKKGITQGRGVVGRQEKTAGPIGQAAKTPLILFADVKADHVHGKFHARLGQFGRQGTGVHVACLKSITHQHHCSPRFSIAKGLGCLPDRLAQRGLPFGLDSVHFGLHGRGIVRPNWNHHFYVLAVPFSVMAVYHQARMKLSGNLFHELGHDLFGNLDLGLSLDLAPHGTGGV